MKLFRILSLAFITLGVLATAQNEPIFVDFDSSQFNKSITIDNEWMPMQPGSHWVFDGTAVEDGETISRRIEFTITNLTKEIEGVNTVVALINDYTNDELTEAEIAFYAQDDSGNVWYFGEFPAEYEEGEFVAAKPWIAGIAEAKPGLKMSSNPELNTPSYFQGWGPGVDWNDFAKVMEMGKEVCVPVNCFSDLIAIHESSLGEENAFQVKLYARGIGDVHVSWVGEDSLQEELELTKFVQLTTEDLDNASAYALAIEETAYEISPDVYALSTPSALR